MIISLYDSKKILNQERRHSSSVEITTSFTKRVKIRGDKWTTSCFSIHIYSVHLFPLIQPYPDLE